MSKQIQNKKAGLYYRLSQEDERAGESLSIENQKKILEKYARENGFEIIDEYIDDGWSGTNFNRPGVQRLLEDAKNGRINAIIVKDLSRFGRNYIEVGQYTDYLFPTYNIRFIAVGDNVDSAVTENTGMDMTPIMNVFNEWHAANTSKKIRAVIEANAKEGIYRSNQAPYGYIKGDDDKRLPIVDSEAAAYVRRMFEMRASGISPNHIAQTYSLFNPSFLEEVAKMKHKNIAVEVLKKLLEEQIRLYRKTNVVQSQKFSEIMQRSLNEYLNGMLTNQQVIDELLRMAEEMRKTQEEGNSLNLSQEEKAFYDALIQPQAVKDFYSNDELIALTRELTETLRKNRTVDWNKKEFARAKMRNIVRRLLRKYKYPPNEAEGATKTVIEQCELWADNCDMGES